eukprot:12796397-Alexandrium_andersonii.AAC.1
MCESALTGQLWALRGAQGCYVKASSHIVRRPSGRCPGSPAVSARGRRPVLRLTPNCYDLADFLVGGSDLFARSVVCVVLGVRP